MKNTVQKNQMNEKLEKSKTGIFGFDDITFGGLPKSRPTLIVGGIGSGKTFMSMLFIFSGILFYLKYTGTLPSRIKALNN